MKLIALMKKEFFRFFHDPRLLITILLPGLFIFAIYNLIGSISDQPQQYDYKVYLSGEASLTELIDEAVKEQGSKIEWLHGGEEEAKAAVEKGDACALVVFSDNFTTAAGNSVEIWYNETMEGSAFHTLSDGVLRMCAQQFTFSVVSHSTEENVDIFKTVVSRMLPFLVVTFVFTACMSVTLESVAGEKERGTLGTILATSVPRAHIALGKILPLSCIAALGAASSFLGVVFSLPKLVGAGAGAAAFTGYGFLSYLLLFLLILSFVPLIVSLITAVSTLSRSVKEASGFTSVVMLIALVVSIVSMFITDFADWIVVIPFLNAVVAMGQILAGATYIWQSLLAVAANIVYTSLLVLLIAKMLSSERIMFGK